MNKKLKIILISVLFFIVLPHLSAAVRAYVMQGEHILELMTKEIGKTRSLLVEQKLILYNGGSQDDAIELKETIRYNFPFSFRSDIISQNAEVIHVVSNGKALTVVDKKSTSEHETEFDCYKDIFLYNSRNTLAKQLRRKGLDVSVASFGRFEDRLFYVVGGQYPDESVPEIWIDKKTFMPFRWILTRKTKKTTDITLEIRYSDWQKKGHTSYPMKIEFFKDSNLVRLIEVEEIKRNPRFKKNIFNIAYLKSIYPAGNPISSDIEDTDDNDESEIQKTIDNFIKIFE